MESVFGKVFLFDSIDFPAGPFFEKSQRPVVLVLALLVVDREVWRF